MEFMAATSSIAGLLNLSGECVSGLLKLKALYQGIANASKTVTAFIKDVNSLLKSLRDLRLLLEKIDKAETPFSDVASTSSLRIQLEDCNLDVAEWMNTAVSCMPIGGRGLRAGFRKFWQAANKQPVGDIRTATQRRRAEFTLSLETLGRLYEVQSALHLRDIKAHTSRTSEVSLQLLKQTSTAQDQLDRIEAISESIASMSVGSMRSLASVASAMSTLSNALVVSGAENIVASLQRAWSSSNLTVEADRMVSSGSLHVQGATPPPELRIPDRTRQRTAARGSDYGENEAFPMTGSPATAMRRAPKAGTRSLVTLTAAQQERKRANDREAQRAVRQRTKRPH
ncbi:hypothetical protein BAUCODRAFT_459355 [Baudoinia panamericana UAMH 10762]|uniref:Fungal N-terminal domain-containing protein n=1 Tax=Baudoinia panamericana (strain UAMH 10762) TaxID=717646 RepID=M2LSX4_BAUPA|nr:uncharacterized protein BAUCODRAFT_459355 [Baudoinia panamericana UAMH 10762]EMC97602.1 hypothetical protein BAUCODRAFT_459355 [Baudoinia panamericana UAMH 10762]